MKVVKSGWQVVRPLTHYLPTGLDHLPAATEGYNITQSSAPDDGHMVAPKHVEQLLEEK